MMEARAPCGGGELLAAGGLSSIDMAPTLLCVGGGVGGVCGEWWWCAYNLYVQILHYCPTQHDATLQYHI